MRYEVKRLATPGPDLLALHARWPERYPFLLESVAHGTPQGRHDILLAFPGRMLVRGADGRVHGPQGPEQRGFLSALDAWWAKEASPAADAPLGLPFTGGWFLFLGYELAAEIEPRLSLRHAPAELTAAAVRVPAAIIRDRLRGEAWIVAEPGHGAAVADIAADWERAPGELGASGPAGEPLLGNWTEEDPALFLAAVAGAQRHIAAGDIFQANLARTWRGELAHARPAWELYARLRESNPAPFAGVALLPGLAIISSSPERLVRHADGVLETRPIAGTRPRSAEPKVDRDYLAELVAHPKERAEHIMLIDLERNDLGRVCQPGTVEVDEFMCVESYAHVHHIVSNIRGRPLPGLSPGQLLRAMFPGGTITGCPKVRCMEIIARLEADARGAYTGSMGYLNRNGSCDLNILIRTVTMRGTEISWAAGSGIVADSDSERELEETRAKAKGLLLALGA